MRKLAIAIGTASVLALMAGCAHGYYGGDFAYDGYYDDYYGQLYGGYWGPDGVFYYRNGEHDDWHRDTAGHFRHEAGAGYHTFHVRGPAGGGHEPGRDDQRR